MQPSEFNQLNATKWMQPIFSVNIMKSTLPQCLEWEGSHSYTYINCLIIGRFCQTFQQFFPSKEILFFRKHFCELSHRDIILGSRLMWLWTYRNHWRQFEIHQIVRISTIRYLLQIKQAQKSIVKLNKYVSIPRKVRHLLLN